MLVLPYPRDISSDTLESLETAIKGIPGIVGVERREDECSFGLTPDPNIGNCKPISDAARSLITYYEHTPIPPLPARVE